MSHRKNEIMKFMEDVKVNDNNEKNNMIKKKLIEKFSVIEKEDELLMTYDELKIDNVVKVIPLDESYILICYVVNILYTTDIDTHVQTIKYLHIKVLRNHYSTKKQYCKSYKINPNKFYLLKSRHSADQYYNTIIQISKQMHLW
jgi:hypothetical protein